MREWDVWYPYDIDKFLGVAAHITIIILARQNFVVQHVCRKQRELTQHMHPTADMIQPRNWHTRFFFNWLHCKYRPSRVRGVDPSATLGHMFEARRAEKSRPEWPRAGVGFLGRGQPAPPHQLGDLGERCKLPQWGPGRSPGRQTILPHFTGQDGLSWRLIMVLVLLVNFVIFRKKLITR